MWWMPQKFVRVSAGVGYASLQYVSYEQRLENHPVISAENKGPYTDPVIPEDYATAKCFYFNVAAGGQMPFDLKKIYLIPAAQIFFGGLTSSNYSALYYGPVGELDLGLKLRYGSSLLFGLGYRYNVPTKSAAARQEASYPGYKAYPSFGAPFVRIAYMF
jgi:hypothetical protein